MTKQSKNFYVFIFLTMHIRMLGAHLFHIALVESNIVSQDTLALNYYYIGLILLSKFSAIVNVK